MFPFAQGERVRRHLAPLSREEKSSLLLLAPNSEGLADVPGSNLAYLPSVEKVPSFVHRPDVRMMTTNTVFRHWQRKCEIYTRWCYEARQNRALLVYNIGLNNVLILRSGSKWREVEQPSR